MQHSEQLFDVLKVQARSWFVQDVQRVAGIALAEFAGQLDALGFAARKRGRRFARA